MFDFLWNLDQQLEISELRGRLERMQLRSDLAASDQPNIKELAAENDELKLRLGLLVRLLIAKGVIMAEEYSELMAAAQPRQRGQSRTRQSE